MRKRLTGLSWLAVINMVIGALGILIFVLVVINGKIYKIESENVHTSMYIIAFAFIQPMLNIMAGAGIWYAKPWAWYMELFSLIYKVIDEVFSLYTETVKQIMYKNITIEEIFFRILFIFFIISIIKYLFKNDIYEYFKIKMTIKKSMTILFLITLISLGVFYLINFV